MKIFLIGFPGSGKTYLGKETALLLKVPFFDTDGMIEIDTGESIVSLFKTKGEDLFRKKEAKTLREFSKKRNSVIAVGGGLPCFHENMKWMNENGLTVYLEASAAFLFHRLMKEKKTRPLIAQLSDIELMIYITETLSTRKIFYEQSQLTVQAENYSPVKLFAAVQKKLKQAQSR